MPEVLLNGSQITPVIWSKPPSSFLSCSKWGQNLVRTQDLASHSLSDLSSAAVPQVHFASGLSLLLNSTGMFHTQGLYVGSSPHLERDPWHSHVGYSLSASSLFKFTISVRAFLPLCFKTHLPHPYLPLPESLLCFSFIKIIYQHLTEDAAYFFV